MKSFKDSWSPQKLETILAAIESYITKYRVTAVALKIPPFYSHNSAIKQLITGIQVLTKSKRLHLHIYTLLLLKNGWTTVDQHFTKRQLVETILQKYNLVHLYKKEMKNKVRHYEKLFEAVGVADMVLRLHK